MVPNPADANGENYIIFELEEGKTIYRLWSAFSLNFAGVIKRADESALMAPIATSWQGGKIA